MDRKGPNKTNWTKQDQSGPMWTEQDQSGINEPNRTKVDKMDRLGPNRTLCPEQD